MDRSYAVILAGGKGQRFWPLSTSRRPKQLLDLVHGKPLVTLSVERLQGLIPPERIFVITGGELEEAIREAAPGLPPDNVVGEPVGRDTAPAVALGMALVSRHDPDAVFCILTADHVIGHEAQFHQNVRDSFALARSRDCLITFGIPPAFASTGFGYIECGDPVEGPGSTEFFHARRFVEKPRKEVAEGYLIEGNYFWNSGMFVWSVSALAAALRRHRPDLHAMAERIKEVAGTPAFAPALNEAYAKLDAVSVDYALMEHADNIVMAKASFEWDDIGAWSAVAKYLPADPEGNNCRGACELLESANNIVVSEGNRLTALIGVKDLVVVQARNATLICARDAVQKVKAMVERLRESGCYDEAL